jgi:regulator of CtrA degradation
MALDLRLVPRRLRQGSISEQAEAMRGTRTMGEPDKPFTGDTPIPFGKSFVSSDAFRHLFREGMSLVEETANYLDGDGRKQSASLTRHTALAYATESMRLTTRLMQIASWLLLQRAVAEGEMTSEQADREKHKVRLTWQDSATSPELFDTLPKALRDLVAASMLLQARIMHLDRLVTAERKAPSDSPVGQQLDMLSSIFGRKI